MNYLQRVIRTNQFPASVKVSSHKSLIKKGIGIGLLIIVIIFILSVVDEHSNPSMVFSSGLQK